MNDQFKNLLVFFASVVYFIIGFQVAVYIFNKSPNILFAFLFAFVWIGGFTFAIYWFKKPKKEDKLDNSNSHSNYSNHADSSFYDSSNFPERRNDQGSSFFPTWLFSDDSDSSDSSDGGDGGGDGGGD